MKQTLKYIVIGFSLLALSLSANAQHDGTIYNSQGGVSTAKNVTGPDEHGYYTIKLETFATGTSALTETGMPVDIVLVLDVSGSMDEYMATTYSYTARASQSYSYSSYGTNTYYYLHTDGEYYAVSRSAVYDGTGSQNSWNNYYTRLSFTAGGNTYYLSGTTTTTTPPTNVKGNTSTIWTGVLYTRTATTRTKMEALKSAVTGFVNEVNRNALYDKDGNIRGTALDHQISIVKFAGIGNNDPGYYVDENQDEPSDGGNHRNWSGYNYTEIVIGLTSVLNGGAATLISSVNSLEAGGATAADGGMKLARNIMNGISSDRESNKVVVMFTDGSPTYQSNFSTTVAGGAINNAYELKHTNGAIVYTIGVFDNETEQIRNYMNWTSSNYPDAERWNVAGTGSDQGYYQNASDADLDAIFKDIAGASSQSDASIGSSTQVRDVVSNSFVLPEGTDPEDVTVYSLTVTEDGNGWADQYDFTTTGDNPDISVIIKDTTCTDGIKRKMLSVEGFDFSLDDIRDEDGFTTRANAGNWVGERYKSKTETFWAGKKLVIEFKVLANGEATGGEGTNTNHPDSGVYVYDEETGTYKSVNKYPVPHTTLPLIIKITKAGLRHGESATFEIHRCEPLIVDGKVQYNALGKPRPDTSTDANWSKVILTNKGNDGDPVTKIIMALDPHYVYSVIEDDWGWAYELSGTASTITTSDMEINPFIFTNVEKTNVVKHAEAVSINHFATSGTANDYSVESYKSSKVESFSNPSAGGGSK